MNVTKAIYCFQVFLIGLGLMVTSSIFASGGAPSHGDVMQFPVSEVSYLEMEARHAEEAGHVLGLIERLKIRAAADPYNIVATVIFFLAVFHTFLAGKCLLSVRMCLSWIIGSPKQACRLLMRRALNTRSCPEL